MGQGELKVRIVIYHDGMSGHPSRQVDVRIFHILYYYTDGSYTLSPIILVRVV